MICEASSKSPLLLYNETISHWRIFEQKFLDGASLNLYLVAAWKLRTLSTADPLSPLIQVSSINCGFKNINPIIEFNFGSEIKKKPRSVSTAVRYVLNLNL